MRATNRLRLITVEALYFKPCHSWARGIPLILLTGQITLEMKQGLTAAAQERDNPHQGMMPDSLHQAHGLVEILRAFRPESENGYDSNARMRLTVIR